ncbi:hypothetical protein [Acinetobacter gerneri]|uniref:hypothetical protein n=1 Tax=Acinetobacter gerneri TaxID=202952 RepID=UPI0028A6C692|nr:hypothetical protein [Acinetobacter gerneri]
MKKPNYVHSLMSDAFAIWLTKLGYVARMTTDGIVFVHHVSNKNFPRDVMILSNGRLNKPATQLFEEFKGYKPFEGIV